MHAKNTFEKVTKHAYPILFDMNVLPCLSDGQKLALHQFPQDQ